VIPRFPVYLFDVDGTLLDSATDICGAIRESLASTAAPPLSDAFLRRYIGRHLRDLYLDVLPSVTEDEIAGLIAIYRRVYPLRGHRGTRVYDGVGQMLAALGGRKSTVTTKGSEAVGKILTQFGLAQYFDHVQGTDGFPAKPEPDVVFKAVEALGAEPSDVLLVGDAPSDMEAGRRAGVKTCAVTWGYGNVDELRRHAPDYWISAPSELL